MTGKTLLPFPNPGGVPPGDVPEIGVLFHRLNNQLGIILANAELLEAKATDEMNRARAAQIVTSVLDAMNTVREIRSGRQSPTPGNPHA